MELYGSLTSISGAFTASVFTGSFKGDGSGLTNIQASGVTGLNLSQIAAGSVTASVTSTGFNVNANTAITGTLLVNGQLIGAGKLDETVFNTYTSSNNTTNSSQNTRLTALESTSGSLNSYTSSNNTIIGSLQTTTSSLNSYTASNNTRLTTIETSTGSLNSFTSSTSTRLSSLETSSGSIRTELNTYTSSNNTRLGVIELTTSSLNTFTSSANGRLNSLESTSSSLVSLSSSVAAAIELTGSSLTIKGDLLVKGTTTAINSTTLDIGDNIISLNGTGNTNAGLVVRDATAPNTVSGSLLWNTTNDQWIAGALGSEQPIVLVNQLNTYTSSVNGKLTAIETSTGSLNSYTSSNNTRVSAIESTTGSINTFTSSANTRLGSLETASGSIRTDFNSYTSSNNTVVSTLQTATSSLNNYTSSTNTRLSAIETSTGSLNSFTSSTNTRLSSIETTTGSLNTYTSSNNTVIGTLQTATGSINTFTSSAAGRLTAIETSTGSLNTFTSSINTTIKSKLNTDGVVSGSAQISFGSITGVPSGLVSGSAQITLSNTTGFGTYLNQAVLTTSSPTFATTTISGGDLKFNPGTGNLGSRYLTINKGASNDGGILMQRDNSNDWQIINSTSTGNLSFYSYGTGGNTMVITRASSEVAVFGTSTVTRLGSTYTVSPHSVGVDLHSTGNIAPHYQTSFSLYYGAIGAGSLRFNVNSSGDVTVVGTLTENSSLRYKKDIVTIEGGLDKVLRMRGVTYLKKENDIKEIGVIAEEIGEILPDLVKYNTEGQIDSVSYGRITAVLIEAIKELKQEINDLKNNG